MNTEYKLANLTFKSMIAVQQLLDDEGKDGWEVHGAGPFYLFLGRSDSRPRTHQVARVLFQTTDWTLKLIEHQKQSGWRFAALSPSWVFFTKGDGEPPLDYWHEGIGLMTPGMIRGRLSTAGEGGWAVRALTANSALFERRRVGPATVEHLLEAVLLRTAGMVQQMVEEKARDGWRVACASRLFIAFTRESARP